MMYKHEIPEYVSDAFSARKNDYCVCVFVINEGERLHKQLEKMRNVCAGVADIVVADGGSTDGSTEHDYLKSQNVRALLVKKSVGKLGTQMRMAFDWALKEGYQGVVVVDGNGKDGIDAIPRFVEELKNGVDHVQGSRFIPGGHHENTPLSRLLGVKLLHSPLMTIASGFRYTDTTNGFRAYSRKLLESPDVDVFRECFSGYELHYYLAIEAARLGFKVKEIPVSRVYPAKGKTPTKISFFKGNFGVLERLFTVCRGEYSHRKTMWSRLTNMSGTQRLFLAFLATFIITTGICIGTWNSLGGQVWQYPDYLFRNGERSGALPPLRQGVTYSQSFTAERDGLNLIELAIACYGRTNNFTLSAVIRDMSDKRVVVSKKIPASTLVETARNKIEFPRIEQSRGKTYRLELHGEGYVSKEDAITIWTRPAISFPCAKVNDREFGEARMIMAFSYLPVYRLHDTILHSETLGLLGVLFLYAIWVVSRRKSINSDSWEKYFYPLLFVVGIGVLMARSASLIAIPDLYTEDAMWSGRIMGRGFGNTFLHARPDYFVSGNVLSLGIGLLINKICFGCNMFYYPIVLVFVQFVIYTLTALLPVVCFRRNVGFLYRLLIFAAFMLLSAGTPGCNYEIFGKVSNIGYIFPFISFCGLVHIYNSHRTIGFVQLALWAVCIQICYMTNPVSNLVVFFFFCMNVLVEMGLSGHSRSQSKEEEMWNWHALLSPIDGIRRLFWNRFFWFTCVLGC